MSRSRKRYWHVGVLVLLLALIAQAGWQIGSQRSGASNGSAPLPASTSPDTPRVMGPMGAGSADTAAAANKGGTPDDSAPFFVGKSVQNDVSPPLSSMKPVPYPAWTTPREMPEPKGEQTAPGKILPFVNDSVLQSAFTPSGASLMTIPSASKNWEGINNINGVYPPDTNGDVGPNHYVQTVNLTFAVWNKNGTQLLSPRNINTLWSGFGGSCQSRNDGDPVVLYDPMADRWLISQFTAANPYGECVAISTTPDPTGSYYRYFFQFSTTTFYDYPKLGVWPDGYYLSANRFTSVYQGPSAIVLDRNKMLTGQAATFQRFNASTSYGTLLPSDLDGSRLPPSGEPNFFLSQGTNTLYLWKFHTDWANTANSTFTGPTALSTAAFNQLCPSTRSCVPQPGTSVGLDGLGDRLMFRLAYRNFGDHESLVANHSVNVASSGTRAGVRWYEIRNPNSAPSIYQQGTYSPDTNNRWLGSVAMDQSGDMGMVYSVSSSSVYPSIRYTGRLAGDPLGQMPQGEATLIAGSGSQTGTGYRWGDYADIVVDPIDDCTFWFTTEYVATTGTASWQTRIGAFRFPGCGGTPPTPTNTPVPGATNTPAPLPTNTPLPTATNTPVPGTCSEKLTNGGFESGTSPWVETSSGGYELIDTTRPHTGTRSAYLGGYNNGTDTIYQQVTIPAGATLATLTYWWNMSTQESTHPWDYMYVRLLDTSGNTLTTLQTVNDGSAQNTWTKASFNVVAYAGRTVRVYFKATTDGSLPTSFFVDDVSLNTCP